MPDNWETYRDWKKLMEDMRSPHREEDEYDDDVTNLTEQFREYID